MLKPDMGKMLAVSMKPPEGGDEHGLNLEECGHDVMDAMKAGDGKAFAAAMKDFVSLCSKPEMSKKEE